MGGEYAPGHGGASHKSAELDGCYDINGSRALAMDTSMLPAVHLVFSTENRPFLRDTSQSAHRELRLDRTVVPSRVQGNRDLNVASLALRPVVPLQINEIRGTATVVQLPFRGNAKETR